MRACVCVCVCVHPYAYLYINVSVCVCVYGKCVCACIIIHDNECLIITYISKYMRVMSNGPFCIFSSSKDFINHCVCVYTCIHSFIRMIHTYIHEYGYTHTHIFDTYIHMHVNLTCCLSLCSHDRFLSLHQLRRRQILGDCRCRKCVRCVCLCLFKKQKRDTYTLYHTQFIQK